MNQSPEPTTILRFTAAERWTHRTLGILMGVLLITAAVLYLPGASAVIGYRPLMRNTHIIAGFLLPIPIIVACFFWAFRQDLRRPTGAPRGASCASFGSSIPLWEHILGWTATGIAMRRENAISSSFGSGRRSPGIP